MEESVWRGACLRPVLEEVGAEMERRGLLGKADWCAALIRAVPQLLTVFDVNCALVLCARVNNEGLV